MRGRETAPREWICRPLIMGGDYTGEIGEGKGVCWGRGPQGTPVWCPRWTDGGKGLILLGNGCGR